MRRRDQRGVVFPSAVTILSVVAVAMAAVAWVATRHPERPVPESGDAGIIARFELPPS